MQSWQCFCQPHWRLVPIDLKRAVWAAYRRYRRALDPEQRLSEGRRLRVVQADAQAAVEEKLAARGLRI